MVLGAKTYFMWEVSQDGRVERYKRRFVAQRFRQVKELHYQESSSPTSPQLIIQMALVVVILDGLGGTVFST